MLPSPIDDDTKNGNPPFERPLGILLDKKQWLYLKERYHMTPRELQVAILVCRGFNNNEIAKALKISYGTVKTHLRNLYRRVRVKSKILLLLKFVDDVKRFYGPSKSNASPIPISEMVPTSERTSKASQKS